MFTWSELNILWKKSTICCLEWCLKNWYDRLTLLLNWVLKFHNIIDYIVTSFLLWNLTGKQTNGSMFKIVCFYINQDLYLVNQILNNIPKIRFYLLRCQIRWKKNQKRQVKLYLIRTTSHRPMYLMCQPHCLDHESHCLTLSHPCLNQTQ